MKLSRKVGKLRKIALPLMKARDRFLDELPAQESEEERDERMERERPYYGPDDIGLRAPCDSFFIADHDEPPFFHRLRSDRSFDDYGYDRLASLDRYERRGLR